MQNKDKFGRKIYPKVFEKLLGYARVLEMHGYKESINKPNLFYKVKDRKWVKGPTFENGEFKDGKYEIIFFADMRGTKYIPIWEEPYPHFYGKFPEGMPEWKKIRLMEEETNGIPILYISFSEQHDLAYEGNGYCKTCGKDFHADGLFCSKDCEEIYNYLWKTRCQVCGKELDANDVIKHHINYYDDKTIIVCRSCHAKIHFGSDFLKLKPEDTRPKKKRDGQIEEPEREIKDINEVYYELCEALYRKKKNKSL